VAADVRRGGAPLRAVPLRDAVLWDVLLGVVASQAGWAGRQRLDIVDVGGGTGGLAVRLAALGHNVTVVDPSPDALAAAQRRAAEVSAAVTAVQGEAAYVDTVTGPDTADLVICHNVLEYVDEPADAMAAIAKVLRPGAVVSVLAANAVAAVLHRALAGRFAEARRMLADAAPGGPGAASGPRGPGAASGLSGPGAAPGGPDGPLRRFTLAGLTELIRAAGLAPGEAHGLRIFTGLVPGALVDGEAGAADALRALESAAADYPPLRDIAAQLHLPGTR
jgi:S-adenosylmethionine-dependent methyltransferase